MLNTLKYPCFLIKMIKTNLPRVCPLCFFIIFAVLGVVCHHCSSLHKTESRQHTWVSTVVNSKAVCVQKICPIRNFFAHSQGSMIFAPAQMSLPQKILAHYTENEHFPLPIPWSLLFTAPCDIVIWHGRGRVLGPRSNFMLPGVVQWSGTMEQGDNSLRGWGKWCILIDFTTPGSVKFDLWSKRLLPPCLITISQGAAKRRDRGISGGKCSFSA